MPTGYAIESVDPLAAIFETVMSHRPVDPCVNVPTADFETASIE
jgi:hypothetical protein